MLLCPSDGRACDSITLPDGVRVVLGRGPQTKIADKKCSRDHLALTADYARQRVLVEQVGPNPSQICGGGAAELAADLLHIGESIELCVADSPDVASPTISFLEGKFEYALRSGRRVDRPSDAASASVHTPAALSDKGTSGGVKGTSDGVRKRSTAANLDGFVTVKRKRHSPDGASDSAGASAMPLRPTTASEDGDGEGSDDEASVSKKLQMYQAKMKTAEERRRQAGAAPHQRDQDCHSSREGVAAAAAASDGGLAASSKLPAVDDMRTSATAKDNADCKPAEMAAAKYPGGSGIAAGWSQPFTHLYTYATRGLDLSATAKVASFDLDGTLIVTASGKKWPQNKDDWTLLSATVPPRLQQLHRDGYTVVVFTNQHGLSKGTVTIEDFKLKIEAITKRLGMPMLVLTATGRDVYRKPAPGMWDYLLSRIATSGSGSALTGCSLYVGDAAGRPDGWAPKKKKDFACTDRLFALNLGLRFHTPEEFFLGHSSAPYVLPKFCPAVLLKDGGTSSSSAPVLTRVVAAATGSGGAASGSAAAAAAAEPPCLASAGRRELVLLSGYPASGKSHFARAHMAAAGYAVVNRDTLGTWQKCLKACDEALAAGKSVVVDNTNPDPATREKYVECARRHGAPCRCFVLDVGHEQALHNERFRQITSSAHAPINDMVMNMHKSKFKEPELSEGFAEIARVRFVPSFDSAAHERLYGMYLV